MVNGEQSILQGTKWCAHRADIPFVVLVKVPHLHKNNDGSKWPIISVEKPIQYNVLFLANLQLESWHKR